MKLSKADKKFIKAKHRTLSTTELAKSLKVDEQDVVEYLKESGKTNGELNPTPTPDSSQFKPSKLKDLLKFIFDSRIFLLSVIGITAIAYLNSLNGQFVSDDVVMIQVNPQVANLELAIQRHNLQAVVYALIVKAFGLNPTPFHVYSVINHLLSTVLVFILVSMLANKKISYLATAIFALHPVNTEAIAWISGVNYITSAESFLLTAIFYLLFRNTNKLPYLAASTFFYIACLILIGNPWSITTVLILGIIELFFVQKKLTVKGVIALTPAVVVSIVFMIYMYNAGWVAGRSADLSSIPELKNIPSTPYLLRTAYQLPENTTLLIWPKNLTLYHEGERVSATYIYTYCAVLALLFGYLLVTHKKNLVFIGLVLWLIAGIAPTLHPSAKSWVMAERYLYVSTIAFAMISSLLLANIEKRLKAPGLAASLCTIVLFGYFIRVHLRSNEWKTPKNLWTATVRESPFSPRAHNNLADAHFKEGDYETAEREFKNAIKLNPNYADAYHNLGNTLVQLKRVDEAILSYKEALKISPNFVEPNYNLGILSYQKGDITEAKSYFSKALELNPNYKEAKAALEFLETGKMPTP